MKPELLVRGSAPVDGPSGAASAAPPKRTDEGEMQDRARRFQRAMSQPNTTLSLRPNQQPNMPAHPRPLNRDAVDAALVASGEWSVEAGLLPLGEGQHSAERDASANIAPGVDLQALADHLAERLAEGGLGDSAAHSLSGAGAAGTAAPAAAGLRRAGASGWVGAGEMGAGLGRPSAGSAGGSVASPLWMAPLPALSPAPSPVPLQDVAVRTDPTNTFSAQLGAVVASEGMAGSTTPLASPPPAASSAAGLIASGGTALGSFAAVPTAKSQPLPAPDPLRGVTGLPSGTDPGALGGSRSEPGELGLARAPAQGLALALNAASTSAGSLPQSSGGGPAGDGGERGGLGELGDRGHLGQGAAPAVSASRRPKDPLDGFPLDGAATPPLSPLPLPLSALASASPAAPALGASGGAEAVWRQVQDMALRMAAGTGANGAHQIRMEIDPRLLPGVQVVLQMSAGQMQMEFVCANDVSRRRLRAAAQRELGPMASRLGCPVQVTLRADGPDAGAATGRGDDAEYLHAAA